MLSGRLLPHHKWSQLVFSRSPSYELVILCAVQVAFVGFAVQALASRTQPIEGLTKHLSNPGYNITYTLTHL